MKFHYEFAIKKMEQPINHHHSILLIGSCFTENIGGLLNNSKFRVLENPSGILFNPVSVADVLKMYINNEIITAENLFSYNESWHSWKHHSRCSGITADEAVKKINKSTIEAHQYLKQADYLFITLGSAWVYQLTDKAVGAGIGTTVANNHKAPSDWFEKKLLSPSEIVVLFNKLLQELKLFNPHLRVIFTISPVRHLREGVIENNRSKAALIQSVHELEQAYEYLYYFPAYELVIDDLRDYRFYSEDLVHPNYHATQYVWEKFTEACLSNNTQQLLRQIKEINLAYQHLPFNAETQAHQAFLKKYAILTKQLMEIHPEIDYTDTLAYFKTGIKN